MWDLPGPGLEPVSPALSGRFLTTAPPGKPLLLIFQLIYFFIFSFSIFVRGFFVQPVFKRSQLLDLAVNAIVLPFASAIYNPRIEFTNL